MKQHYSEADLLETYYTQPGASMPVMMHLADCPDCAARYERLEKKVRGLAACAHEEKPETFWARQRIAVLRKVEARRSFSFGRVAAAAMLALTLSGVVALRVSEAPGHRVAESRIAHAAAAPADEPAAGALEESPWESDELSDLHSMVAWESWIDNAGDQSL